MVNARQQQGRETQSQRDDDKATTPSDLANTDESSIDELSASLHIISTAEERRQRHQGSGDDNGYSDSDEGEGTAEGFEGTDDDRGLRDELRPKDGSAGA